MVLQARAFKGHVVNDGAAASCALLEFVIFNKMDDWPVTKIQPVPG